MGSVLPFSALRAALSIGATTLDPSTVSNIKAEVSVSPVAGLRVQVAPTILVVIGDQSLLDIAANDNYWRIAA